MRHTSPAPPDFPAPWGGDAVAVRVLRASHRVNIDVQRRSARVRSGLTFRADRPGHPMLLLLPDPVPMSVRLDGQVTAMPLVHPTSASAAVRVLDRFVDEPDSLHELTLELDWLAAEGPDGARPVQFGTRGVEVFLPMSDLAEWGFLEQYLPSNFEHDLTDLELTLTIAGAPARHVVYCNGRATHHVQQDDHQIHVVLPGARSSSLFLHVLPHAMVRERATFQAAGTEIVLYTRARDATAPERPSNADRRERGSGVDLADFEAEIDRILPELARDFGPVLHDRLIVYARPEIERRSMEYVGAIETRLEDLRHELVHQWFGRAVTPTNGQDGWIDEAIASWYDRGCFWVEWPYFGRVDLRGRDPYQRRTLPQAYTRGAVLIGYLDHLARQQRGSDGLMPLLSELAAKRAPVGTRRVLREVIRWFNDGHNDFVDAIWLRDIFDQYVFGSSPFRIPPADGERTPARERSDASPDLKAAATKPHSTWLVRAVYVWATRGPEGMIRRWVDLPSPPPAVPAAIERDPRSERFVTDSAVQFVEYLSYLLFTLRVQGRRQRLVPLLMALDDPSRATASDLEQVIRGGNLWTPRIGEAFARYAERRAPNRKWVAVRKRSKRRRVLPVLSGLAAEIRTLLHHEDHGALRHLLKRHELVSPEFLDTTEVQHDERSAERWLAHLVRTIRPGPEDDLQEQVEELLERFEDRLAADAVSNRGDRGAMLATLQSAGLARGQGRGAGRRQRAADALRAGTGQPGEIGTWFAAGTKNWGINFRFTRPLSTGDTWQYYVYGETPGYEWYDTHQPTSWDWRRFVALQEELTYEQALDLGGQEWLSDRSAVGLPTQSITLHVRIHPGGNLHPDGHQKTYG